MAREFKEIKKSITDRWIGNLDVQEKYSLTPGNSFDEEFSLVSLENMIFDTLAFEVFSVEKMLDIFVQEQDALLDAQKVPRIKWYQNLALGYQHGQPLIDDGVYDTTGDTEEEIAARMIIAHAAVYEVGRYLFIKVAKYDENEDLVPLSTEEKEGFEVYMEHVKTGGTRIKVISLVADDLRIYMDIYYNPAVLNQDGKRKDGTNDTPVQDAIALYLKFLRFNGAFIGTRLVDYLQTIEGVEMPILRAASAKYAAFPFSPIGEVYFSEAGYMRLEDNLAITHETPTNEPTIYPNDQSYLNFVSYYERT